MATLLLRLAAPLQAWGAESKFEMRRTQGYPTKSGVIGMIAAALGYARDASLEELNALRFGIRIDWEGTYLRDYHTAHGKKDKDSYITNRFYLADAVFLVGLESSDLAYLQKIQTALQTPVFPLFLGRRSCPPTMPLQLGIRETDLMTALRHEPWLLAEWRQKNVTDEERSLRIITDTDNIEGAVHVRDQAVSFCPMHRMHTWRYVQEQGYYMMSHEKTKSEHDAFAELG